MNYKAMLELADHMERMPEERFNMNSFGHRVDRTLQYATLNDACGTTCCIAGEKVLLDGGVMCFTAEGLSYFEVDSKPVKAYDYAVVALALTSDDGRDLFFDYSLRSPKEAAAKIRLMASSSKRKGDSK